MPTVTLNPTDPRVARLGRLAAWSTFEALGRLAVLRARCAELGTDTPGDVEIEAVLDSAGTHLVRAGLGEPTDRDGVRVLEVELPKRGRAGGLARAANARRDENGRLTPRETPASECDSSESDLLDQQAPGAGDSLELLDQQTTSDASRASDQICVSGSSDLAPSELPDLVTIVGAERAERAACPPPYVKLAGAWPPRRVRDQELAKLSRDAWAYAATLHAQLLHLEQHAITWPVPAPPGIDWIACRERVAERAASEDLHTPESVERVAAVLRRRIEVAAATARRLRHLHWFIPERIWNERSFAIDAALSPQQAAQSRGALARAKPPRPEFSTPLPPPVAPEEAEAVRGELAKYIARGAT